MIAKKSILCGIVYLCGGLSLILAGCALPAPTGVAITEVTATETQPATDGMLVWIENTYLNIYPAPGNIAWSNNGNFLAYTHGFSIWIVPVGRWSETSKVYTAGPSSPYILSSRFLAWSPNDRAVGFTLFEPVDDWQAEPRMAQLNWREQTISFISEENVELIDWSTDNFILTRRSDGVWILDASPQIWQPLVNPLTGETTSGFPHWSSDGMIVLGSFSDWRLTNGTISTIDRQSSRWETISMDTEMVQMVSNSAFPSIPVPSPDGRWIAWIEAKLTSDDYIWRIMLYDRECSKITQVANNWEYDSSQGQALAWSPDSRRLAFSAWHEEEYTIWILHLNPPN